MPITQNVRFIGGSKNNTFHNAILGRTDNFVFRHPAPASSYKAGDRVRCVKAYSPGVWLTPGKVYTVVRIDGIYVRVVGDAGREGGFYQVSFEPADVVAPREEHSRRRIVLDDGISRYEETCFVLDTMSDVQAAIELRKLASTGVATLRLPKMIETLPLPMRESTLIAALGYDLATETLDVTFKNNKDGSKGATYRYSKVGLATIGGLLTAESVGSFYCTAIRRKFDCVKLG